MKLGIIGGSFNPPHKMHHYIATELIKRKYLDKVIFVPTGDNYPKKELVEGKHRLKMLKLMTQNHPNLEVSDYEVKSSLVFTFQTLNYFKEKYPHDEIYFICGTDNLKELNTWKKYQYILENFKIIVIKRNQTEIAPLLRPYQEYQNHIITCDLEVEPISSTEIRNLLKKDTKSEFLNNKLHKNVLQYIYKFNLYQKVERRKNVSRNH